MIGKIIAVLTVIVLVCRLTASGVLIERSTDDDAG